MPKKNFSLKKLQIAGFSILSGLLLWAAWPVSPFTFLIFIAWIPLLQVAEITKKRIPFFFYSLLTAMVWNVCATWWIWNSTDIGSVAAIFANSLLMTLPWWGFHIFKNKYGKRMGFAALIIFWMAFEYIHLNWQLSWPWLTLGNVFASHPDWVQWYEYTGTGGGTLWVLIVNVLLYDLLTQLKTKKVQLQNVTIAGVILIFPFVISIIIKPGTLANQPGQGAALNNVIIVQPNIDPYNDKFDASTLSSQLEKLISLSEKELDSNTRLVIWPETALPAGVWQEEFQDANIYQPVFAFTKRHTAVTLVTGIETYKSYGQLKAAPSARFNERDSSFYDVFNAAVAIKANAPLQFYNKSKLVPGVETLPDFLLWMAPVFEKFGGTASGYGKSKESAVFAEDNNPYICAPIICYESIYGEYVASYAAKGANLLTIITNDGWWGNTPGHKQHLEYARLRAIETRKWVVRSANTGISAVINRTGEILQTQPWNKPAFIKANVPAISGETFYVLYGDVLLKTALVFALLLTVWNIVLVFKAKLLKRKNS